ncbi:hypothetical protein PR003_g23799 [Phytophthora rubi]|uniref:Uncharacterized protein n=1 Tax=Phytophthora rubi TaxID=129364 RepID=A0A6A3J0F3_9STRA|nr:hypothetical protein PR002_g21670 [Phytophthora rubi]KAE9296271.1 hypothetical protein PR003_g23799 [Phytophthora rubi]
MAENPDLAVPETLNAIATTADACVTFDAFDSDNVLDALRRGHLFEPSDADDLNVGGGDWLLALGCEAEGDEESILLDEDDEDGDKLDAGDDTAIPDDDSDSENATGREEEEVPIELDISEDDLDRLRADE